MYLGPAGASIDAIVPIHTHLTQSSSYEASFHPFTSWAALNYSWTKNRFGALLRIGGNFHAAPTTRHSFNILSQPGLVLLRHICCANKRGLCSGTRTSQKTVSVPEEQNRLCQLCRWAFLPLPAEQMHSPVTNDLAHGNIHRDLQTLSKISHKAGDLTSFQTSRRICVLLSDLFGQIRMTKPFLTQKICVTSQ